VLRRRQVAVAGLGRACDGGRRCHTGASPCSVTRWITRCWSPRSSSTACCVTRPVFTEQAAKDPTGGWQERLASLSRPRHPVVRVHPETGERALFVNPAFTTRLDGFRPEENEPILRLLHEHIAQAEHVVRWHWREATSRSGTTARRRTTSSPTTTPGTAGCRGSPSRATVRTVRGTSRSNRRSRSEPGQPQPGSRALSPRRRGRRGRPASGGRCDA
jgi:hypothetical protein